MTISLEPAAPAQRGPLRPISTTHLFTVGEDFVVYAGGEDFLTLELGAAAAAELVSVLRGETDLSSCTALDQAIAAEVTAELAAEGLLAEPGAFSFSTPPHAHAVILGDGVVADAVRTLLPGAATSLTDDVTDLVIACAGWLPDAAWLRLDAELAARGIAWHRCWGDGTALHIGPLTVPGEGPGYDDVRRRQLAATDSPDLLLALWSHWDRTAPDYPSPDPGSAAIAAGLLAADALDLLAGRVPLGSTEQRELNLRTRDIISHPVLPVPGSAWLPTR